MSLRHIYALTVSEDIFSEHTWLQGAFLAAVAYGMEVILYLMSMSLLWRYRYHPSNGKKRSVFLMIYITIIIVLGTVYIGALLQFTQDAFVDGRNIPGGPSAYEDIMFSQPVDMLANSTMVVLTWLCDLINVWRCVVVYRSFSYSVWLVIAFPLILYLLSFVLGILWLNQFGSTSQSPWSTDGINFTIPYYSMSLALNILVTVLIVMRVMYFRARLRHFFGEVHGSHYASLAAMLIESAMLYSIFAFLFIIPFALKSPLSQLFLQALSPIQIVSTLLIIFRVAQGKGLEDTHSPVQDPPPHSRSSRTLSGDKCSVQFRSEDTLPDAELELEM